MGVQRIKKTESNLIISIDYLRLIKHDLNHGKAKVSDKKAEVKELLATEDEENVINSELYWGSCTAQDQDL